MIRCQEGWGRGQTECRGMEIRRSIKGITERGVSTKGNTERAAKKKNTGGWRERHQSS